MRYKIKEGIARADVAFQAFGATVEELFENAGEALTSQMADVSLVSPNINFALRTKNLELEDLLFEFLSEIIFYKDSKSLLFCKYKIRIDKADNGQYRLLANLTGEKMDIKRHRLGTDVKAVTKHKFFLKKEKNRYICQFVLDI